MENSTTTNINPEQYEQLLRKNFGLISIKPKIPVKDRKALSFVYTPGVGACCKLIEADPNKAYELTNKQNSVLVITDTSGFEQDTTSRNCLIGFPYVEAFSFYYKRVANIDAYPLIIDCNLAKSREEFHETIKSLMPAFSVVELFGVDQSKFSHLDTKNNFAVIGGNDLKTKIEGKLNKTLNSPISSNLIFAGVIRAALDLQIYENLNKCVEYVVDSLCSLVKRENISKIIIKLDNYSYNLLEVVTLQAAEYFVSTHKIGTNKIEEVKSKLRRFVIEGSHSWIHQYPQNYFINKNSINDNAVLLHLRYRGVMELGTTIDLKDPSLLNELISWRNLKHISNLIKNNPTEINNLTCKGNYGAVITNGTAILGFGDIGTLAGLPVMEGKCVLFKVLGATNFIPLCIEEKNAKKFISIVNRISPSFSAINLEDIKSPECFEIESSLIESTPYPVFHDDQHGTAVVVVAGVINSLKLARKKIEDVKIVMNGAGAAGLSVTELLITCGAKNVVICDTNGAIYTGRTKGMNLFKDKLANLTNRSKESGKLEAILKNSDVFIGVSAPGTLTQDMIRGMNKDPIIFALANPVPEILPHEARSAGALVIATGRSDFKNQVNNSMAFPGIFRAALDTRAKKISIQMKIAASYAIANLITEDLLSSDYIIPDSLDTRIPVSVAKAVSQEAIKQGLATNIKYDENFVEDNIVGWLLEEKIRNWEEIDKAKVEFSKNSLIPKF